MESDSIAVVMHSMCIGSQHQPPLQPHTAVRKKSREISQRMHLFMGASSYLEAAGLPVWTLFPATVLQMICAMTPAPSALGWI
jgi:hypothetical protein